MSAQRGTTIDELASELRSGWPRRLAPKTVSDETRARLEFARAAGTPLGSVFLAIAATLVVSAWLLRIGADSQWLSALGRAIVSRGHLPAGVPFAASPSGGWQNPLVLAEVALYGLDSGLGDRGLMLAQLLAVSLALTVLARDALSGGASGEGVATAIVLAAIGAIANLFVVRLELFSLALFPVLVLILRSDLRRPTKRVWLVVGIIALWANLHGAVLVGLLVALVYLALSRSHSRATSVLLGIACIAAVFLTPALLGTADYYRGVFTNVAAQRGAGLWAAVSLESPLDVLALVSLLALGRLAYRARPKRWEIAALVALAAAGGGTSRSLLWLLLLLVPLAARGARVGRRDWGHLLPACCAAAVIATGLAFARGPVSSGSDDALIARAIALAHGSPILAPDLVGERIALKGGRIWLGNPLDAFRHSDQAAFIDWTEGAQAGRRALTRPVLVVLASRGSAAARLTASVRGFVLAASDRSTLLYLRRS